MNVEELRTVITGSGYKIEFIAQQLGISYMALNNKLSGRSEFKVSEIRKISKVLNLSGDQKQKIFDI